MLELEEGLWLRFEEVIMFVPLLGAAIIVVDEGQSTFLRPGFVNIESSRALRPIDHQWTANMVKVLLLLRYFRAPWRVA